MPTRLWNAATSCGMAVIAPPRAISAPTVPPIATPPTIHPPVTTAKPPPGDHRGNGVGPRHERCGQGRRHAPDHVVADEDRQHEDRQAEDGGIDGFHLSPQLFRLGWTTAPPWVTRAAFRISSS